MTVLLFPQQRNGPTYWLSSPQTFADICHPNCTIDPLSLRIVLPLLFRARFKTPQTYPHICQRSTVSPPPRRHRHVFVPTARVGTQWAEIRFFPVTALVTTHTCSVTLMEMTELQECLEVSALTVPLPLGNVCHPALRKCHYRFVSMRWQRRRAGLLQEHTIYISRTDIYSRHNIRSACKWVKYNSASFVIP